MTVRLEDHNLNDAQRQAAIDLVVYRGVKRIAVLMAQAVAACLVFCAWFAWVFVVAFWIAERYPLGAIAWGVFWFVFTFVVVWVVDDAHYELKQMRGDE